MAARKCKTQAEMTRKLKEAYRYFDRGYTRAIVAKLFNISWAAADNYYQKWQAVRQQTSQAA